MLAIWRKLFPKYACKRCKDTGMREDAHMVSVCECQWPRVRQHIMEVREQIDRLWPKPEKV